MVASIGSTMSGAANVWTLTCPMGQSEFNMSMTCLARTPCGVFVSILTSGLAAGALGDAQPVIRPAAVVSVVANTTARRKGWRALALCVGPGNVQHNLELEQRRTGGYRIGSLAGVGGYCRARGPGRKGLLGLPLGHDEIAIVALDRAKQLEPEEARLVVDRMGAIGESFLQLGACARRHLDCVDLHHGHVAKATAPARRPTRAKMER